MRRYRRFAPVVTIALAGCAGAAQPASGPDVGPIETVSVPGSSQVGDTVYLVEHFVRPERREQFEQFVEQVLWPALERTSAASSARQHVLRQTRLLRPLAPNPDNTLTFTFVLDPVVPGESYNVLDLLREVYSEEEAQQQYARYTETWAREFTSRPFVRSR